MYWHYCLGAAVNLALDVRYIQSQRLFISATFGTAPIAMTASADAIHV